MPTSRNVGGRRSVLSLADYQRAVAKTDESKKLLVSLLGLVGEIGDIETVVKRRLELGRYPSFRIDMAEEIGDTLWYLSSLASVLGLSLSAVATQNIEKAKQLHSSGQVNVFDRGFPKDERLPRKFEVVFQQKELGKQTLVKILQNGVIIGDALTDNAHHDDGYRFHDAFHLGYAAVLGWSPVTRALLRRKRKSQPKVDEVEDGARAAIVEEAISLFLFHQAKSRNDFRERSSIDISILKTVRRLCGDLEVKAATAKQWRQAIFKGYEIFRLLRDNQGGVLDVDLDAADVTYRPVRTRKRKVSEISERRNKPRSLAKGLRGTDRKRRRDS